MQKRTLGFVGAGRMATALACGVVRAEVCPKDDIIVSDACEATLAILTKQGYTGVGSNEELFSNADVVFLAVKPKHVDDVARKWKPPTHKKPLLISVVAGLSMDALKNKFPGSRVVRAMPNTPCLIGKGASAFCTDPDVPAEDKAFVQRVFGSVGIVYEVDESQMDAVTGVSGSGPAYAYTVIEAMAEGGVRSGLPYDIAVKLAAQTLVGAGEMVLSTNEHPAVLKSHVCSPGGTTIAAVAELEDGGIRATLMSAVAAAVEKSEELAEASADN